MNRKMLLEHLAVVERHVLADIAIIRRQVDLIRLMVERGVETVRARELLKQFQDTQKSNLAERDRLLALVGSR